MYGSVEGFCKEFVTKKTFGNIEGFRAEIFEEQQIKMVLELRQTHSGFLIATGLLAW